MNNNVGAPLSLDLCANRVLSEGTTGRAMNQIMIGILRMQIITFRDKICELIKCSWCSPRSCISYYTLYMLLNNQMIVA